MTRQEIEQHNARVQAHKASVREEGEKRKRDWVDKRWAELGYTDNPSYEEKLDHLAALADIQADAMPELPPSVPIGWWYKYYIEQERNPVRRLYQQVMRSKSDG